MYKTLAEYRLLLYALRTELVDDPQDGRYWIAEYPELPGCKTEGNTEAEAVANLHDLFDQYIETMLKNNSEIPLPTPLPKQVREVAEVVVYMKEKGMRDSTPTGVALKAETNSVEYKDIAMPVA